MLAALRWKRKGGRVLTCSSEGLVVQESKEYLGSGRRNNIWRGNFHASNYILSQEAAVSTFSVFSNTFSELSITAPRQKVPLKVIKTWKNSFAWAFKSRAKILGEWRQKTVRIKIQTRYWCVCMMRVPKNNMRIQAEWKIAVSTAVFLPYSDINEKKQRRCHTWKISPTTKAQGKKSRVGKYTIFFICLLLATNSELETGIFPSATLFSPSRYDIKQYFLGFSIPVIQCEKIFC